MKTLWSAFVCCLPLCAVAESTLTGDLPRRDDKPLEEIKFPADHTPSPSSGGGLA